MGSNLASLAGALWLAQRLDRTLLIDWRGQRALADPSVNYFSAFLSLPPEIDGVEVRAVPDGDAPFAPDEAAVRWLEPGDARALGTGAADAADEYLALKTYHGLERLHPGSADERFRLLRAFYRRLEPHAAVRESVDEWVASRFAQHAFTIGVNVRTGNGSRAFAPDGAFFGRFNAQLMQDDAAFLRLVERACAQVASRFPAELRESSGIFVVTDSARMSALLGRLRNAATRRSVFPPPGVDHAYAFDEDGYSDRDGIVDTLTDMFLLARCDGLVYNSTMFGQYARVTTGYYGGNHVPLDALSPRARARRRLAALRRRLR